MSHQLLAIRVLSREQGQDLWVGSLIVPNPIIFIQTSLIAGADPGRHLLSNRGRGNGVLDLARRVARRQPKAGQQ